VKVAGKINDFDPKTTLSKLEVSINRLSRPVQFAVAATFEALADAGLLNEENTIGVDPERSGVTIGTGIGAAVDILESWDKLLDGKSVKAYDL